MKTKEINVWVDKIGGLAGEWRTNSNIHFKYKAKLIIEIPEQKIEITESQLEEAYNLAHKDRESYYKIDRLKKELGFKDD